MEKLLNLTLLFLSASCAAENVTVVAVEGDTISVNCSYDARQWWREKSWCRQLGPGRCRAVVSAPPAWLPLPRPSSRAGTSIRDNARAGLLTVTMRGLRREDAGLYQCRTEFLGHAQSLRRVRVEVLAADLVSHVPEEPRAVQSISRSPPDVDFTVFYILAGFLVAKLTVAVLAGAVALSRKSRERGQNPELGEQQELPLPAGLGRDGIGLSWEGSA
ncbi:triggering receptor expressed on myeloid cells 2-like isoform 2-T2 [Geothlypis trichas]